MDTNPQSAIDAALFQNWDLAIKINKKLLKDNKKDVEILCRLAYAYTQVGQIDKAKRIYRKILTIDKFNTIAQKNYNKIGSFSNSKRKVQDDIREKVNPSLFIEEPGKTKTVQLIHLAPSSTINKLCIGDTVYLHSKKHSIEIRKADKTYLGALPDDIAFRLIKFIEAGNTYMACIKNIQQKSVTVFIREISRGKKLPYQPTFLPGSMPQYTTSLPREVKNRKL